MEAEAEQLNRENPYVADSRPALPGKGASGKLIWAVLALFVALALSYSVTIPISEAADEHEHLAYSLFIRDHGSLPVAAIEDNRATMSIAIHPPLYYALAVPLLWGIDTSDFQQTVRPNPRFSFGDVIPNVFLHSGQEQFPYRNTALAFHVMRLWSITLGGLTVYAAYRTLLLFWPDSPGLASLAVSIFAFNPAFVFMSSTVHNDVAVALLYTLGTWWAVSLLGRERLTPTYLALGGVLLGLTAVTKVSGLGLVGVYGVAVAFRAWRLRSWGQLIRPLLAALLLGGVIAGWWYVSNWRLYGDPLAWGLNQVRFKQMLRGGSYSWLDFLVFLTQIGDTFWGAFGYSQIKTSYAIYALLWGLMLAAGIGLSLRQVAPARPALKAALALLPFLALAPIYYAVYQSEYRQAVSPITWQVVANLGVVGVFFSWSLALLLASYRLARPAALRSLADDEKQQRAVVLSASLLILVVALFRYSLTFGGVGFGRLLFPTMAALACLTVTGWRELAGERWLPRLVAGVSAGLLVYGLACVPWIIRPTYHTPEAVASAEWQEARPIGVTFDGALKLAAAKMTPDAIHPGKESRATISLYWQSLTTERWDMLAQVQLSDPAGQNVLDMVYWPVDAGFPPSVWQPGAVYADEIPVIIPANAYVGRYKATVRLLSRGSAQPLPAADAQGEAMSPVVNVGEMLVAAQVENLSEKDIPHPLDARLGSGIRLRGYGLDSQQSADGPALRVTLYWQAVEPVAEDYTVFVQALDGTGKLVMQKDNQPVQGTYPTSLWKAGEIVADAYLLPIPAQLPPGDYRLIAGMYLYPSLQRLPVVQDGNPGKDYVDVSTVRGNQ